MESLESTITKDNIIIYNINETPGEVVSETLDKFLTDHMKVSDQDKAKIVVKDAYRSGPAMKSTKRPITVHLDGRESKRIVMSHAKNLKESGFSISDHMPKAVVERRMAQLPSLGRHKAAGTAAKLVRDKLIVNKSVENPGFER